MVAPSGSHHPQLDTGQARVNNYHHPERYLIADNGDTDPDEIDPIDDGLKLFRTSALLAASQAR